MQLVLGIDLGTSYFKLAVYNHEGYPCGIGSVPVAIDSIDGVRAELPVARFWTLLSIALDQAVGQAHASLTDIQAVSYSSQVNSFILLDSADKPLTPLILYPDLRSKQLKPTIALPWQRKDFLEITGLGAPSLEMAVAKWLWFKHYQPGLWAKVAKIQTISDYLVYSLIGKTLGDEGTTPMLGLWDLKKHQWSNAILGELQISETQLCKPLRPGTVAGKLSVPGAEKMRLKPGIPLAVGSLDHHMAAIGGGVGIQVPVSESTGTVLACLRYIDSYLPRKSCCMGAGTEENLYYQLAFDSNGARAFEWYQQTYAPDMTLDSLSALVETVNPGSDGLIALPLAHTYPDKHGFIHCLPEHHHGHFCRAIMESTASTLLELVRRLCGKMPPVILSTGGGARSDIWLQIKADMLGVDVAVLNCEEPSAQGAAMLAAIAAGWFKSVREVSLKWVRIRKVVKPNPDAHKTYIEWKHKRDKQIEQNAGNKP